MSYGLVSYGVSPFVQQHKSLGRMNHIVGQGARVLGLANDGSGQIPEAYKVRITSISLPEVTGAESVEVVAVIQENMNMKVESAWEPVMNVASMAGLANQMVQFATKMSLVTKHSSRRIWRGSSPITLSLPLKFQAYSDPRREVVEPCISLQKMALPSQAKNENIPFLAPPGPSPFALSGTESTKAPRRLNILQRGVVKALALPPGVGEKDVEDFLRKGEQISVNIGRFMTFKSVIVKEAEVVWGNKYSDSGYPVSAEVMLTFETYEMLTKQDLDKVYNVGMV